MIRHLLSLHLLALSALPAAAQDPQLAARARGVFQQYCHRCHNGEGSQGGDFDMLKPQELIQAEMLVAKNAGQSHVFQRIVQGEMPPRGEPALRAEDMSILWRWIQSGAPDFPVAEAREFVPLASVLTRVRDHLREAPLETRPYLRFFTLNHLHNNPAMLEQDLRLHRAALSKALNSLSWKARIVLPQAIDPRGTVFVVDVRDLDWDRDNLWNEIARVYPYGLKYRNHPSGVLKRLDEHIADLTQCDLALVRADWFVATATRPPLYHTLLRLPKSAKSLANTLGVDMSRNFLQPKPERIARGGFAKSGVSGQNRMVERHDAKYGAFWISRDFKPGTGRSKLTRFPLGPLNLFPKGKHPFPFQAFVHDGGEIICNLPNGLQAYLLVNGNDDRIDEGPIDVVSDPLKTSGTPAIVTGVSCMACHKRGMIPFKDTIRRSSAVFGQAEEQVRLLYPKQDAMAKLVAEDTDRFMRALAKAIGPFLQVGADANKPLDAFPEPVGEVARRYRLTYLDLKAVACEMDLPEADILLQKVGEKELKRLGLQSLLTGGVIGRVEWEAMDGISLMQELARMLRYTPFAVR